MMRIQRFLPLTRKLGLFLSVVVVTATIFCGTVATVVSSFQHTAGTSSRRRIPIASRASCEPSCHTIDHMVRIREQRLPHLLPPQQERQYCRRLLSMSMCRSVTSSSDTLMDEADAAEVSSHKVLSTQVVVPPQQQQQQQLHLSQHPSNKRHNKNRLTLLRQWIRRTMVSISLTTTLIISRPLGSSAATTTTTIATAVSSSKQSPSAVSIRPGMSKTQVDALEQGDVSVVEQLEQNPSIFQKSTKLSDPTSIKKESGKVFNEYGDTSDEDNDEDLLLLFNDDEFGQSKTASQEDKAVGDRLRASTSDQFAAYHSKKSVGLTIKVAVAFFGPTYGFMFGREYVRRRREEAYVKKGLEILEAQKAEYFNITGTSNDIDVQDELKDLKNKNATNTDSDEDDDDDDDDDDDEPEPPPTSRRTPRKPLGDPPKNSGGNGSSNNGNDKPSAEDIDKLNKLLGKS
jgi:hypothetical protein